MWHSAKDLEPRRIPARASSRSRDGTSSSGPGASSQEDPPILSGKTEEERNSRGSDCVDGVSASTPRLVQAEAGSKRRRSSLDSAQSSRRGLHRINRNEGSDGKRRQRR